MGNKQNTEISTAQIATQEQYTHKQVCGTIKHHYCVKPNVSKQHNNSWLY